MSKSKEQEMIDEVLNELKYVTERTKKDLVNSAILRYAFKLNTNMVITTLKQYNYDQTPIPDIEGWYGKPMERWLDSELEILRRTCISSGMKQKNFIEILKKFNEELA